jgi:cation diffusion facilitator CzcD-associated flavoprotein CzcO
MHTRIAIIGSGFAGLGAAIRLKRDGIDDFLVFERACDVGGTWRDNTYPGCACDVESHLYSLSFALEPGWTRRFSRQPEIWAYLQRCAREFAILPHVRFKHEVQSAQWSDRARRWELDTTGGSFTADVLVVAAGPLSDPITPDLPGLSRFEGRAFHSAQWDHGIDLRGRHVAVIGTGASAIQFIPEIQKRVAALHLFQRTPAWVLPRPDGRIPASHQRLYRRLPILQRATRLAIYLFRESFVVTFAHPALMRPARRLALWNMTRSIADPALRARLTPAYAMGCKRILLSSEYYPAVAQSNVEVVTTGIREIRPHAIVDGEGMERTVDTIIFATGFRPTDPPIARAIRGRKGLLLADAWQGSPKAHRGSTVSGFPNLFILLGPNTGLGHNSVVYMTEAQIDHLLGALRYMQTSGVRVIEPTPDAQGRWVNAIDRRMRGTVWMTGGCASWYVDRTGRNSTLWPGSSWSFYRRVSRFRPADYQSTAATAVTV